MGNTNDDKILHLHKLLDTTRKLDRLLISAKNTSSLLKEACNILVNTRAYLYAGITLFDSKYSIVQFEWEGNDHTVEELKSSISEGRLPDIHKEAIENNELKIIENSHDTLSKGNDTGNWITYIFPFQINNDLQGTLCAAILQKEALHPKERTAFIDIANNLGFKLGQLKLEEINRKNEIRYRKLVDSLSDALFILQDDVIKFVNPSLCQLSGYTEEELLQSDFTQFIAQDELTRIKDLHKQRKSNRTSNSKYESIAKTKSGVLIPVEVTITLTDYNGFSAFQVILRDISAYKSVLKNLKESEEHFRFLSNSSFEGILIHDKGIILDVNDSLVRLSGYSREELLGQNLFTKIISESDRQTVAEKAKLDSCEPYVICVISKNGKESFAQIEAREIVYKGKHVRIAAIRDVSQQYHLENQVKQTQEHLNRLLNNLPGVAYNCKNNKNWDMNFMSQGCLDLFGYHPHELIQSSSISYEALIHPDDREYVWQTIQKAVENKKPFEIEYRVHTKEKEEKWVWERGTSIKGNSDILLEGFITDITRRKSAAEEVEKSEENYRILFNAINDAIFIHPLQEEGVLNFTEVNEIACKEFGYTQEEFQNLSPRDLLPPGEDQKILLQENRKRLHQNKWSIAEFQMQTKNGKKVDFEISSRIYTVDGKKMILSLARNIGERRVIEEELKRLLHDMSLILDNDPTFIIYKDTQNNILRVTQTVAEMTGLPKEEIEGKSSAKIYPELADQYYQDDLEVINSGQAKMGIIELLKSPAKEDKWLLTNKIPIKDNNNKVNGIILFSTDITKIKQYEDELIAKNKQLNKEKNKAKEEQQKYQELFSNSATNMLLIDPESGEIIDANQAACKFYKYSHQEITSLLIDQINTLSMKEIKALIPKALENDKNVFEFQHRLADGTIRDVESHSGSVLFGGKKFLYSIIHDITSRNAMARSNQMLSKAMESSPVSIVITDSFGKIEYVNPFFEEKTGYKRKEALGQNPRILKSGDQPHEFYKELWSTISSGKTWHGEFRNKKKDGECYWEHASISPIFDRHKNIIQYIAVKEDITEKKETLKDLQEAKEKAEVSDKLKSSFLANMSHEIRTPMNGILGFTELLKEPNLTGDQQTEFIDIIQSSSERMLSTINDIIDISKIESGLIEVNYQDISLSSLIKEIYVFFKPLMQKKDIEFKVNENNGNPVDLFYTDPDKLNSILNNLIRNAYKFTAAGCIEFGYTANKVGITFFVSDTGVGIPKDRHKAIFERFVQADIADSRVFEGSGLGLSITKSYTEMLNGTIEFESEVGKGTSFHITIPISTNVLSDESTVAKKPDQEITTGDLKLKILIAEDDLVSVELLKLLIHKIASNILVANNGIEAVELAKNNPDIDLILMDVKMPKMDGFTATTEIRKFNSEVKIVAQTAFAHSEDSLKAFEIGCDDFITKPINKHKLLESIKNIFENM